MIHLIAFPDVHSAISRSSRPPLSVRSQCNTERKDLLVIFSLSAVRYDDGLRTTANVEPKSLVLSMNHVRVLLLLMYASLSGSYLEIAIFVCLMGVCILRV